MTFLSILIALLLERIFPQFVELRRFDWLREYGRWMVDVLHIERFGNWGSLAALMIPLMLVVWMASGLFDKALFGLFELAFNVALLFFLLGPQLLDRQVDDYIDAVESGDETQQALIASQICGAEAEAGMSAQVRQVSQSIFVQANTRIFALLFWFVLLGPVAALAYRVLQQMYDTDLLDESLGKLRPELRQLLGWLDWIPVRITLFAYMISGNFDEALQAYRHGATTAVDIYEQNLELLQQVGEMAIHLPEVIDHHPLAVTSLRKARGLVLRSLVVWLLIVAATSWI